MRVLELWSHSHRLDHVSAEIGVNALCALQQSHARSRDEDCRHQLSGDK